MKQAGMDPLKVSYVVLSHLHEDHTGTVAAFKNAQVITGPGADTGKLKGSIFLSLSALTKTKTALGPGWDLAGDGSILLIAGGGHTREDLLLWMNPEKGPILLAGDVVVHWDWLHSDDVERVAANKPRIAESRNQIRKLLQVVPAMVLYPGHDTANLKQNTADIITHNPSYFKTDSWPALKNK
jgi:N-acyl homoserine lactone hydrolase